MIKGKIYYKGRNIKYKVVMKNYENDFDIIVKTKLGKFISFTNEIIIDKIRYDNDCRKINYDYEYVKCMVSFLDKWDKISNKEVNEVVEKFIKREVDKDMADSNVERIIRKHIENFNGRGNYGLPKASIRIPMPKCKELKDLKNITLEEDMIYTFRSLERNIIIKQIKIESGITYERYNPNQEWERISNIK